MTASDEARTEVMDAVASYVDSKTPPLADDYCMLARLRIMYKNKDTGLGGALRYFLEQHRSFDQIYGEVVLYALTPAASLRLSLKK